MRKIIAILLIVAVIYGAYYLISKAGSGGGMPQMGAMPVSVAKVIQREVRQWDEFSGRLEAVNRVEIRPRVAGTIESIHFNEGQIVKKGDLLFVIDPRPYNAAIQSAGSAAVYANAEFQRAKKLLPVNAISRHDYDDKRNAAQNANALLTKAKLDLGYTQIRAPISGRINRAEITVGNLVNAGGDVPLLTTIVSLDPIYASFDVDEQNYVRYMHASNDKTAKITDIPVKLGLSGDVEFKYDGHIRSFDNELNTRAGTVRVRAVFDNKSGALIPGLYARTRVNGTGKINQILINEVAISTDQNRKLVFVVGADNKVEAREISLGPVIDDLRTVTSGLKGDESLVVVGLQRVHPGAEVIPQAVSMEKPDEKQEEKK